MAGWRPHTDQVGQTGTKIAPDIYIACGISGATQHMAGCKGAKAILVVNTDPEAPILASADYAVIGDLHEVVPAISAELGRRAVTPLERRLRGRARRRGRDRRRALRSPRALPHAARPLGQAGQPRRRTSRSASGTRRRSCSGRRSSCSGSARASCTRSSSGASSSSSRRSSWRSSRSSIASRRFPPGSPLGWLEQPGLVRAHRGPVRRARARGRRGGVLDPQGAAAGALRRLPPRRGRPHPRTDRGDRDDAAALARDADRAGAEPWPADWSPVSDALAGLFGDDTTTEVLERVFVWAHVLIILGFLAYLPHSKHLHIATAAINVFFGRREREAVSSRSTSRPRTRPRCASAPARSPT